MIEFVDWDPSSPDDLLTSFIYCNVQYSVKRPEGFGLAYKCCKTGDERAEVEAAKAKFMELIGDRHFHTLNIQHGDNEDAKITIRGKAA